MGIRKYSKTFKNIQKLGENIQKLTRNIRKYSKILQVLAHLIDFAPLAAGASLDKRHRQKSIKNTKH